MPLDGHSFLVAQGWAGKGKGLREGAISRPIAIPQKRTVAGVGKDRDDAFPFWDHLFSAAAKSIQLKIHNSDSEDEFANDKLDEKNPTPVFSRTSTGILSTRRPVTGTSAETSGASTPIEVDSSRPKYSLLVTAKREAARRNLYSRFFRGPVLGPDFGQEPEGSSTTNAEPEPEGESQCSTAKSMKRRVHNVVDADGSQAKELKVQEDEKVHRRKKSRRKSEEVANRDEKVEFSGKGQAKISTKLPEKTVDHDEEERKRLKRDRKKEKKRARGLASREACGGTH